MCFGLKAVRLQWIWAIFGGNCTSGPPLSVGVLNKNMNQKTKNMFSIIRVVFFFWEGGGWDQASLETPRTLLRSSKRLRFPIGSQLRTRLIGCGGRGASRKCSTDAASRGVEVSDSDSRVGRCRHRDALRVLHSPKGECRGPPRKEDPEPMMGSQGGLTNPRRTP